MSRRADSTYKYWWLAAPAKSHGLSRRAVIETIRKDLYAGDLGKAFGKAWSFIHWDRTPCGDKAGRFVYNHYYGLTRQKIDPMDGMQLALLVNELEKTMHQRGRPRR